MDRAMHLQMNGYHTRELNNPISHPAGTSLLPDYQHQTPQLVANSTGLSHPQQSSHSFRVPHDSHWPTSTNNIQQNHQMPSHPFPQPQSQFNPAWVNQMQQFSMGINPLFQQQIFQDALAMSQPVEAADEPLLVQTLITAKKKKESYKDALNGLHGVSFTD